MLQIGTYIYVAIVSKYNTFIKIATIFFFSSDKLHLKAAAIKKQHNSCLADERSGHRRQQLNFRLKKKKKRNIENQQQQ